MTHRGVAIVVNAASPPRHPVHAKEACQHHWILDSSNVGTCTTCQEQRDFGRFAGVAALKHPKPPPKRPGSHAKGAGKGHDAVASE